MSKNNKKNQQLAKELQKRKSSKNNTEETPKLETQPEPKKRGRRSTKSQFVKPKKKRLYGIIEKVNNSSKFSFDYLVGRSVKIIQEHEDRYEAVIRHPGYEGVIFYFLKDEISIIEPSQVKIIKEFFEE
jgi:hypothetical protein